MLFASGKLEPVEPTTSTPLEAECQIAPKVPPVGLPEIRYPGAGKSGTSQNLPAGSEIPTTLSSPGNCP